MEPEALSELQLGPAVLTPSRNNGFLNMLEAMRKRTRALSGGPLPSFPSLKISATDITPQGAFAEAQAQFLRPDPAQVDRLVKVCAPVLAHRCIGSLLTSSTVAGGQQPPSERRHCHPSWLVALSGQESTPMLSLLHPHLPFTAMRTPQSRQLHPA